MSVPCRTLVDMGKNNQQRRAAKRKARAAAGRPATARPSASGPASTRAEQPFVFRPPPAFTPPPQPSSSEADALALIQAAVSAIDDVHAFDDAVRDLVVFSGTVPSAESDIAERSTSRLLLRQVSTSYENGWQPLDLLHVVRRESGTRLARLAADVVIAEAVVARAGERAPQDWSAQLEAVAQGPVSMPGRVVDRWNVFHAPVFRRVGIWDVWHDVLMLLGHWLALTPVTRLVAPPSKWGTRRAVPSADRREGSHDPKKLATIRALLAKAEATEYAEEADSFTAKAQDLMTRYAIDEALLADPAEDIEIRSRRVHIDNPYAATKAQLLATVGKVNLVKTIWDDQHGMATIVGLPVDLDLAEMLFTSLLVQATKAMTEAGSVAEGRHRLDRSPSFRRAFLLSYANRIGERLGEAGLQAQNDESVARGRDLVPVLARQSAAVATEFARLFPNTTSSGAKRVDARGWQAGRAAADRAVLARGQVDGRSA
jgi:hypothetical protein